MMQPRASAATTSSTSSGSEIARRPSIASASAGGCSSRGVMSLNTIPGRGKSERSRTNCLSFKNRPLGRYLAQVADQEQVLEVRRHRRQILERLDRLLAAVGIP